MNVTERSLIVLKMLAEKHLTVVNLTDDQIVIIADLVHQGLARDFSAFAGRRIPIKLRIWGISPAGKAILEQNELVRMTSLRDRRLNFDKGNQE